MSAASVDGPQQDIHSSRGRRAPNFRAAGTWREHQCRDIGFTTSLAKSRGRFFPSSARQRRPGELLDPPRDPANSAKINCKGANGQISLGRAHGGSKISTDMGTRPTHRAECSRDRLRGSVSRHRHASASRCVISAASGRSAAARRGVVPQDLHGDHGPV